MEKTTVSVCELAAEQYEFVIPDYQRGYRWDTEHIEALIRDITEFKNEDLPSKSEAWYCLQPVMVASLVGENRWQVIDGQNRLTTIALMLFVLDEKGSPFNISYDNKPINFQHPTGNERSLQNFDADPAEAETSEQYYIAKALKTIRNCFEILFKEEAENSGAFKEHEPFKERFAGKENKGEWVKAFKEHVKIIWQEELLSEEKQEGAISAFERINIGRIPLNDTELIRAKMLMRRGDETHIQLDDLHRLAEKWYDIERWLRKNDVWYFFMQGQKYAASTIRNRIELLFLLYFYKNAEEQEINELDLSKAPEAKKKKNRKIFQFFERKIDEQAFDRDRESFFDFFGFNQWFTVGQRIYNMLPYYHRVGFLLFRASSTFEGTDAKYFNCLHDILDRYGELDKDSFKKYLLAKLNPPTTDIDELNYGSDNEKIRQTLFLYSLAVLDDNKRDQARLLFARYYSEKKWEIEHIRPQAEKLNLEELIKNEGIDKIKNRLKDKKKLNLEELIKNEGIDKIKNRLKDKKKMQNLLTNAYKNKSHEKDAKFEKKRANLINDILGEDFVGIKDDQVNSISNLTLLPKDVNSSISNSLFASKVKKIEEKVKKGVIYLLPGTQAIFTGVFSDGQTLWKKETAEKYHEDLEKKIDSFLRREI